METKQINKLIFKTINDLYFDLKIIYQLPTNEEHKYFFENIKIISNFCLIENLLELILEILNQNLLLKSTMDYHQLQMIEKKNNIVLSFWNWISTKEGSQTKFKKIINANILDNDYKEFRLNHQSIDDILLYLEFITQKLKNPIINPENNEKLNLLHYELSFLYELINK